VIDETPSTPPKNVYNLFTTTVDQKDEEEDVGSPLNFDTEVMLHAATASLSDLIRQ
jgi:hypothetical protein